jgi:hypothetical protein
VNARFLLALFDTVYLLALATWLGGTAFFTFGLSPWILKVFDAKTGEWFIRDRLPRFYAWGATAGAVALPALVGGPLSFPNELRGPAVGIQAIVVVLAALIMLYCGNALAPAIGAVQKLGAASAERFRQLQRRLIFLNCLVMVLGASLIAGYVLRPKPRSSGIQELTPQERAAKSFEAFQKRQAEFQQSVRGHTKGTQDRE